MRDVCGGTMRVSSGGPSRRRFYRDPIFRMIASTQSGPGCGAGVRDKAASADAGMPISSKNCQVIPAGVMIKRIRPGPGELEGICEREPIDACRLRIYYTIMTSSRKGEP